MGARFAFRKPETRSPFFQIRLYRHHFRLLIISSAVNIPDPNSTIAPFGRITRRYCSHSGSSGIFNSHFAPGFFLFRQPYGRSHKIMSTDPSGIDRMTSRQSPQINSILFSINPISSSCDSAHNPREKP